MHDLFHIVTGYGRDPLGEACLTAFSFAQTGLKGFALIATVASQRISHRTPAMRCGGRCSKAIVMDGGQNGCLPPTGRTCWPSRSRRSGRGMVSSHRRIKLILALAGVGNGIAQFWKRWSMRNLASRANAFREIFLEGVHPLARVQRPQRVGPALQT
jgi:hypothetical protein